MGTDSTTNSAPAAACSIVSASARPSAAGAGSQARTACPASSSNEASAAPNRPYPRMATLLMAPPRSGLTPWSSPAAGPTQAPVIPSQSP